MAAAQLRIEHERTRPIGGAIAFPEDERVALVMLGKPHLHRLRTPIGSGIDAHRVLHLTAETVSDKDDFVATLSHSQHSLDVDVLQIIKMIRHHQHGLPARRVGLLQLVEGLPRDLVAVGQGGLEHAVEELAAEGLRALRAERRMPVEAARHAILGHEHHSEECHDAEHVDA